VIFSDPFFFTFEQLARSNLLCSYLKKLFIEIFYSFKVYVRLKSHQYYTFFSTVCFLAACGHAGISTGSRGRGCRQLAMLNMIVGDLEEYRTIYEQRKHLLTF
jgi:hypothetical protein